MSSFNKLQFANHDAEIYGIDVSSKVTLWDNGRYGRGVVNGTVGWLHGKTTDTPQHHLYHMMPLNGQISLEHTLNRWVSAAELQLIGSKVDVDPLRNEPKTAGYGLINLRTGYHWSSLSIDFGIENLFDKQYYPPLGGVNFDDYMKSGWSSRIQPLAGLGRSFNVGVNWKF
ncbi:hypothetical protein CCP3SC15_1660001 [Gammaproteobacteria bacterium]